MFKKIDFTNCEKVFGKAYNGANGKKIAVNYAGSVYMLKFPPSADKKPTEGLRLYKRKRLKKSVRYSTFFWWKGGDKTC